MSEANQEKEQQRETGFDKKVTRRRFLKILGKTFAAGAVGAALGLGENTKNTHATLSSISSGGREAKNYKNDKSENSSKEQNRAREEQGRVAALYGLRDFMHMYTSSSLVDSFLANASQKEVEESFTKEQVRSANPARHDLLNTWQLITPIDFSNPESSKSARLFFALRSLNPDGMAETPTDPNFREEAIFRCYLDKTGEIAGDLIHFDKKLTKKEMIWAFVNFVPKKEFRPENWKSINNYGANAIAQEIIVEGYKLRGQIDNRGRVQLVHYSPVSNFAAKS